MNTLKPRRRGPGVSWSSRFKKSGRMVPLTDATCTGLRDCSSAYSANGRDTHTVAFQQLRETQLTPLRYVTSTRRASRSLPQSFEFPRGAKPEGFTKLI